MDGAARIGTRRVRLFRAAVALVAATLPSLPLAARTDVYGKPLRGLSPVSLSQLVSTPGAYAGKTVRTAGRVASVAGKGGFTLEEAGRTLRVAFRDPSVSLPQGAVGSSAAVEGLFSPRDGEPFLEASGAELTSGSGKPVSPGFPRGPDGPPLPREDAIDSGAELTRGSGKPVSPGSSRGPDGPRPPRADAVDPGGSVLPNR